MRLLRIQRYYKPNTLDKLQCRAVENHYFFEGILFVHCLSQNKFPKPELKSTN